MSPSKTDLLCGELLLCETKAPWRLRAFFVHFGCTALLESSHAFDGYLYRRRLLEGEFCACK
jgi:hypothetical protein